MILGICLTTHRAELLLKDGGQVYAESVFAVDNDLSKKLLVAIDSLFQDAGVDPLSIDRVEYDTHESGFTTERIGQTVVNTYNYVLASKNANSSGQK